MTKKRRLKKYSNMNLCFRTAPLRGNYGNI